MASSTTFVIVGGGLAGAKAVEALRRSDFGGRIILFGDEEHLPYDRPPLSKESLAGKKSLATSPSRPPIGTATMTWMCGSACGCRHWIGPHTR